MAEEHISDDTDLVIIELGINDLVTSTGYAAYERLVRSALEMKNKPAVINIECVFFDLANQNIYSSLLADIISFSGPSGYMRILRYSIYLAERCGSTPNPSRPGGGNTAMVPLRPGSESSRS
jgi:hypothetical protein